MSTLVTTVRGPVRGERRADGSLRFLGIPYAQPPVGSCGSRRRCRRSRGRSRWTRRRTGRPRRSGRSRT
ncbi:carboxylesterase family protein [Streptomyces diastatochromogenes]|nr:carboxylesterase family protein [Streptomyces diastatochromogenes]